MGKLNFAAAAIAPLVAAAASPSLAAGRDGANFQIKPIVDGRLRYEDVNQGPLHAHALTLRIRGGAEAKSGHLSLLAEGEATVTSVNQYNAFPFIVADSQRRPQYAVVADPENIELNRLQAQYAGKLATVTLGRQRIELDDQRWVGSVGWRQNEQTFDALRVEAKLGPVSTDVSYAIGQRTVFGREAGPRGVLKGDFLLTGARSKLGRVQGKLFAYLLDYDEPIVFTNSSQTYGAILSTALPLGRGTSLTLRGSYARQSDYGRNPFNYSAPYVAFEAGVPIARFNLLAGWEKLGSDNGHAVQAPMATLHKFNGWVDMFLTTPAAGLQDAYVGVSRKVEGVRLLPGLNGTLVYHRFDSARGGIHYGNELDASVGFKIGKVGLLAKLARYNASHFGADTRKLWLQAEWTY